MASRVRRIYWRHVRRHDGEICEKCGRPVDRSTGALSYWRAPDELWLKVEGAETGIRCIPCFAADARAKGISVSWSVWWEGEA